LEGSVPAHTKFEEDALFPRLRLRLNDGDALLEALACLSQEHERDEELAQELVEILKCAVQTGLVANPETLGYMLRGYFESQRRHIAWENGVVLPVAQRILTFEDIESLQLWVMASDHPRCTQRPLIKIRTRSQGAPPCRDCPASLPR
jgi:hemerythrin-like domain-containing protein